jgi:hypothetical protein
MEKENLAPFCLPAARAGAPVVLVWPIPTNGTSLIGELFVSTKNKAHIIAVTTNGVMAFFDSKTGEGETQGGTPVTLRMLTPTGDSK